MVDTGNMNYLRLPETTAIEAGQFNGK